MEVGTQRTLATWVKATLLILKLKGN